MSQSSQHDQYKDSLTTPVTRPRKFLWTVQRTAHTLHTQYCLACDTRMSSWLSLKRIVFPVNNFCHSRVSCLISIYHDLISHHCHFCNVSPLTSIISWWWTVTRSTHRRTNCSIDHTKSVHRLLVPPHRWEKSYGDYSYSLSTKKDKFHLRKQFRRGHHYHTFVFESEGWKTKRRKTDFTVSLQKREGSAVLARICHSIRKFYVKRKSSRDPRSVQETHKTSERIRNEQLEVRDHLHLRADESVEGEQASLSRLSEAEFHAGLLVE